MYCIDNNFLHIFAYIHFNISCARNEKDFQKTVYFILLSDGKR